MASKFPRAAVHRSLACDQVEARLEADNPGLKAAQPNAVLAPEPTLETQ
jgi:hypothetical protein